MKTTRPGASLPGSRPGMPMVFLSLLIICLPIALRAQDSTKHKHTLKELVKDVYKNFVVVQPAMSDSVFFMRSETSYQKYAGKKIRTITIRKLPFGQSVTDTSERFIGAIIRIANNLESGTQEFIIRQMLFIKEGEPVEPFRMADNERYLRDLDFIKDARIYLHPTPGSEDSVDVWVVVRDQFSFGGSIDFSGVSHVQFTAYDANLFGRGQRIEYTTLYDYDRKPHFGSGFLYRKYNAFGSFVNVEGAITSINQSQNLGRENETVTYVKLDRPLYSSDAKFAGGFQLNKSYSSNKFGKPDSLFHNYSYRLLDIWAGYNIGAYKPTSYHENNHRRIFAALRYFDQHFYYRPVQPQDDQLYFDKKWLLGQLTFYKIDFYQTNYIYGFGITEDLPVGYAHKITVGHTIADSLGRMYFGWEYDHMLVDGHQNYWNYSLAIGSNYYKGLLQDNSFLLSLNWFSRLFNFNRIKLRQFANMSFAGLYKRTVFEKLRIDNDLGLNDFSNDSVRGNQRVSVGSETDLYTRLKILGFKLGFFAFGKSSLLAQDNLQKGDVYCVIGGGVRARNENLIFGTVELKFAWIPRLPGSDMANIKLTVSGNLRLKYSGTFVQAPAFARIE